MMMISPLVLRTFMSNLLYLSSIIRGSPWFSSISKMVIGFPDKHRKEALQHPEIGLLPKQPLDGPVKPDVPVLHIPHIVLLFRQS